MYVYDYDGNFLKCFTFDRSVFDVVFDPEEVKFFAIQLYPDLSILVMIERRIILVLGFALILMFCSNFILAIKLKKSGNMVCVTCADSIEGLRVNGMSKEGIIFIVPSKICESCVILAVSDLINNYRDSLKLFGVNVYLILERESLILISFSKSVVYY